MGRTGGVAGHVALAELIVSSRLENRPIWLDTSALLSFLEGSHAAGSIIGSLVEHPAIRCGISAITLAETMAGPARFGDELAIRRLRNGLVALPRFQIDPFNAETATITSWLRVRAGLKLPDAGIIASARQANAVCIIGNYRRWRNKPIGLPFILLDELPTA